MLASKGSGLETPFIRESTGNAVSALNGGAVFRRSYNVFRDSPIKRRGTMCDCWLSSMEGTSL